MSRIWINHIDATLAGYRRMIDRMVAQLSDEELHVRPAPGINSVGIILRHLGGNLSSRWTDYLTTDGEKPHRDRDTEFLDWDGDRQSLLDHFDHGWSALVAAVEDLDETKIESTIYIRGEAHTVAQALLRSVNHIAYHVGQIAIVSRMVHQGDWQWQTVAPGDSAEFNRRTWGTSAARSVLGDERSKEP